MKKQIRSTLEEIALLGKLNNEQLRALIQLADHKSFNVLVDIVNTLIDHEKNIFFAEKEIDPTRLSVIHAYSKGGIARLESFLRIIIGANRELQKREEKSKS